ncbi:MAG TPA: c(7)-type cytochrome triheme domain-containing protein [Geobacteraceae bacterium]
MPYKTGLTAAILIAILLAPLHLWGDEFFNLPQLPPPEGFGTLLINRTSVKKGMKPVVFSHWQHRLKYTCRVCHGELEFTMEVNTTEITEMGNRRGRFCGACHNGKVAFKANGNCDRCHTGDIRAGSEKFPDVVAATPFPRSEFGNGIDWAAALRNDVIAPRTFLKTKSSDLPFDKLLVLEAEMSMIPPAVFPHKSHTDWLDCSNCHPDIFNIKKKTTKHFAMAAILRGEFCGACHLNVAFPMNDCMRCHPKNKAGV